LRWAKIRHPRGKNLQPCEKCQILNLPKWQRAMIARRDISNLLSFLMLQMFLKFATLGDDSFVCKYLIIKELRDFFWFSKCQV
jgi:hypothetical protein